MTLTKYSVSKGMKHDKKRQGRIQEGREEERDEGRMEERKTNLNNGEEGIKNKSTLTSGGHKGGGCMRGRAVNNGGETVNILHILTHAYRH